MADQFETALLEPSTVAGTIEQLQQVEILPEVLEILARPTGGKVSFNDVYSEKAALGTEATWRLGDFDAELTQDVRTSGFPEDMKIPVGFNRWHAQYGLVLVDDLRRVQLERASRLGSSDTTHPDALKYIAESKKAVVVLGNYAPRDQANTAGEHNGSDFYLAVTDAGVEYYVTPLSFLTELDARDRVIALYKIPNEGHPEFDGAQEQYRSSIVTETRLHPEHLVPVFQYRTREELIEAKHAGIHPTDVIPSDPRAGHIGFVDKYGNVRLSWKRAATLATELGRQAVSQLLIKNNGAEYRLPVHTGARNLRSAPLDTLSVYVNCADPEESRTGVGYVELVARVDEDPNTSTATAIFRLLEAIPDLDFATAEVDLVA